LPFLAVERWRKSSGGRPDRPVALVVEAAHGQLIHAVSPAAAERGACRGMRLTDARAMDPRLRAEAADPIGDAALLKRLARLAGRWSPLVEVDGEDGLRLDISGVAHLFGGEKGLAADIQARFAALGLTAHVALAPTAGAAWALARFSGKALALPPVAEGWSEGLSLLAPLPVAALRLEARTVQILGRLGLKTIGQLAEVPRKSLQRRFREADNPLNALDRALGRRDEPLAGEHIEPPPRALARLAEPATHPEAAAQALDLLVPELARQLEARKLGARRLHLAGYRVDGSLAIPSREPKHLMRLLIDKAGTLDPEFGFDAFALTASWCEPLGGRQESLVEEPGGEAEVAKLVDRLTVKLGPQRVRRPAPAESHLPERANGWRPALDEASTAKRPDMPPRPQHLLDRPEGISVVYATPEGLPRRFIWRRLAHDIARVEGPERIAPEWWRERSTARLRDYYRVEDKDGRRYWIFREGLAGDGRGGAPEWYVHGLFG